MLRVTYRKNGLRIASIWFAQDRDRILEKNCDIAIYHQIHRGDESKHHYAGFSTLNTNLSYSEEDIMSRFCKNLRYQIRRAEREGIETYLYDSKALSQDGSIILEFCKAYNKFLQSKKLPGKCNINAINAYVKENSFFISCARHNGRVLVYHAYIGDGKVVRLLYSASLFRLSNDQGERALIGQANRLLHWKDILLFKGMEYSIYDWGGFSQKDEVNSIAEFKKNFGGDCVEMYNCHIPCSLLGSAALNIQKSLDCCKAALRHKGVG